MKRIGTLLSLAAVLGLACLSPASILQAEDWPQWRGPNRDGISAETGLKTDWPAGGPPLLWQVSDLGIGYSTPAVVGDRIYILGSEGLENEFVRAISADDGETVWTVRIGNVGHPEQRPPYPGARSTPTVDGDHVYVLGSDGDLVCLEAEGGAIRWQKNVRTDFGGQYGEWAYAESPLIDGDALVCSPGGAEATMLALNKHSGEVIWKSAIPEADEAAYASIVIAEIEGTKQYVQFLQKGLVGVDAATGKPLWRYGRTAEGSPANIPTPVVSENYVFSGTNRGGAGLVRIVAEGEGEEKSFQAEEVYYSPGLPTSLGGTVLIDGHLYGTNNQAIMCVEFATGDVKWQDRGIGPGSLCFADGHLIVHGENGEVLILEATAEAYREKGRFTPQGIPDRGRSRAWSHPVISQGRLYIQDFSHLWVYDVQGSGDS
jgi:outer membrane protein assembly factor BamB